MEMSVNKVVYKQLKDITLDMHQGINTVTEKVKYLESGIPILQSKHITKGFLNLNDTKYLSESDYNKYKEKYQPQKDDVLICNIGTIGSSLRIEKEDKFLIAWNLFLVKIDKEFINSKYLAHYLNFLNNQKYFDRFLTGGTVKFINKKTMQKISVPLPPLPTQKKIAAILDEADTLRQLNKDLITKYDALAQSLFLDMFGDPGMSSKKGDYAALRKLIIQKPDNGFFAKKDFYNPEGVPIVWLNNFIDKLYIEQDNLRRAFISPKDEKYTLEYGDALFCRSSLTAEGIGKCAIVPRQLKEKTLFECHIIRLKFNVEKIIPEYFRFLSDTRYFRGNIEKRAKTSTMTTISQEGITDIKIPVPPIHLQNQFAERVAVIVQQKAQAQQSLQKSEELFNSLLQKAFKGELVK